MEIVLMLLCTAGLAFAVSHVDGPFGVFGMLRNLLAKIPLLGPFVVEGMNCDFCLGFWSSVVVFVLSNGFNVASLGQLGIWAFGGGMFNFLFHKVLDSLDIK